MDVDRIASWILLAGVAFFIVSLAVFFVRPLFPRISLWVGKSVGVQSAAAVHPSGGVPMSPRVQADIIERGCDECEWFPLNVVEKEPPLSVKKEPQPKQPKVSFRTRSGRWLVAKVVSYGPRGVRVRRPRDRRHVFYRAMGEVRFHSVV